MDIFYLDSKPVLHVVDEATAFNAAKFLKDISAESIWRALKECWMDAYIGLPQGITHDAGKQFTAREFQSNAAMLAIKCNTAPVESHGTVGMVEKYHTPLRRDWNVIEMDIPARNETERSANLQTAVKAVNDSAGPNGLVPTLLVFGAMPRLGPPYDAATETTTRRAAAVRRAIKELNRLRSHRQV